MQRKFVTYLLLFFTPVVIAYCVIEYYTLQLPMSFKAISTYMHKDADKFEVLVLGSSQMKGGINPEYISQPTLNLAGGNQHHDTDFKILKQLLDSFPALKTVVLETSYSHFELPHNGKQFYKNNAYLKYYGVNTFERQTYFKDKLIFLSNPKLFSERILDNYSNNGRKYGFNTYGYDTLNYPGLFEDLQYNEAKISEKKVFKINKTPNTELFATNTALFFDMLEFLESKNLNIILCEAPMYKTYLPQRVPEILYRRDSIIMVAKLRFKNLTVVALETDTINYSARDYWNQSHLNPKGGEKFSKQLDSVLRQHTP
ncbi:hypothetical protein G5B37_01640 [Rasiella rasia]|uniref:DUF1574 domain-containing protein n=1 Tax=Rasiella rasia TaxID=2744027 RepID=A0A6G6GIB4_9FLAO|nr:hypothetical protein [Rasiella rasia]QIE58315.1 hypothetical protein G5B37_01640 [Rasiella rasia]